MFAHMAKKTFLHIFVTSEASNLIWKTIHFLYHTYRSSFVIKCGGRGGSQIWAANYAQMKAPIGMKFGMQVRYSAT